MSSYYLILILSGSALWGIPVPYPEPAQCEAAGQAWRDVNRRGRDYYCLPGPIVTGESINRRPKNDAFPATPQ